MSQFINVCKIKELFFETNLQDMSATKDIISWNVVNIFKTFSEAVTLTKF
jgi:hypothetical protein